MLQTAYNSHAFTRTRVMRVLDQNVKAAVLGQYVAVSKGTMSEAELHILKARMLAGRRAKAQRGELGKPVPMGYVRRLRVMSRSIPMNKRK